MRSQTQFKPRLLYTVLFDELAEAYQVVQQNQKYKEAHANAIEREEKLRNQRPNLKGHNPGGGPGDVVIKR